MTKDKSSSKDQAMAKANILEIRSKVGQTKEAALAQTALDPATKCAQLVREFSKSTVGDLHLMECIEVLKERSAEAHRGDLSHTESLLVSQAQALDALFAYLALRSKANLTEGYLDASDRLMRLALKAQSQCRTTLETLATIENPPVVMAKQANINHGLQQINQGVGQQDGNYSTHTRTHARAENSEFGPNKLLEQSYEQRLDLGTTATSNSGYPALETLEEIDRAQDTEGQSQGKPECLQGR